MPVGKDSEDQLLARAISLFTFLREVVSLRAKVVRDLDSYEKVIWFSDVPEEPECQCVAWPTSDPETASHWLEVKKPRLHQPPAPPEFVRPWIDETRLRDSSTEPHLYERILADAEAPDAVDEHDSELNVEDYHGPAFIEIQDCPDVQAGWQKYLDEKWRPWADIDRRKQKVHRFYTDLFTLYQLQSKLGESYEIVVGLGQLRWTVGGTQEVNRHLISVQTSLEFDAARGVITLGPSSEGAKPQLEQDMLEPTERPAASIQTQIEQMIAQAEEEVWHNGNIASALTAWAHSVGQGQGSYTDALKPLSKAGATPCVSFSPAVVLRRRTERGLLHLYKHIIEDLSSRKEIPPGLGPLVDAGWHDRRSGVDDGGGWQSDGGSGGDALSSAPVGEVYFPLPSNEEQREIVDRLRCARGVLVQGPPGTGKSHTIANLISHLLANGKRVLVTSQTPRALRVLKEKVPKQLTDLCVVLLGQDHAAFEELESSIQGITQTLNHWDVRQRKQHLHRLEEQLAALRQRAAEVDRNLRSLREADTYRHAVVHGHYSGTLQQVATRLGDDEEPYGWLSTFAKDLSEVPDHAPVTNDEAMMLLRARRDITDERERELQRVSPKPHQLISADELDSLFSAEACAREAFESSWWVNAKGDRETPHLTAASEMLTDIIGIIDGILAKYANIESHIYSWAPQMVRDVLADQDRAWQVLVEQTKDRIAAIETQPEHVREVAVSGIDAVDLVTLREDAKKLAAHLEAGGRIKRWFRYTPEVRDRRYIVENVRVGGKPCTTPELAGWLFGWADTQYQLRMLDGLWAPTTEPPVSDVSRRVAVYRDYCEPIEAGLELHQDLRRLIAAAAQLPQISQRAWHDVEQMRELRQMLHGVLLARDLDAAVAAIDGVQRHFASNSTGSSAHDLWSRLCDAVAQRDIAAYQTAVAEATQLDDDRQRFVSCRHISDRLREVLPELAAAIQQTRDDSEWDERLRKIERAWAWLQTDRWLIQQIDPRFFDSLVAERRQLQTSIQSTLADIAAEKAWQHCLDRMTSKQETYLKAWMQAIQKIGAGTGKRATRYRKVARQNLEQCRSAIPAWIMPLYRVVESVTPGEDIFDVAIIDEASQSGMEALFLNYIAKQIVVVGDDKQIAPDYVGASRDDVELLRKRHISELPLSDHYDLENSFFDQAFLRYGNRIRLREHFRCMPEIIEFSNALSYNNEPLIPLRQYGADRLTPTVIASEVTDGFVKGRSPRTVNPPEAKAIVEQIAACCNDPAYAGKTFGVISLLGEDQARLIESELIERIGPEEIERRRIVCGDAYAFQGDERHVMFLSLVAAPDGGQRTTTLAGQRYERRFNVAASRAQDQMWLFYSTRPEDMSPKCLRRRLLEYCINPGVEQESVGSTDVAELRAASAGSRASTKPPEPFDSWFEVDVFLAIHARGYRVLPQHSVAGYRIDLVVTGNAERIAIECDGDEWHGPERYEADMARQRQLERCGWRFYRIRGGAYYRDPEECLRPLWLFLDKHLNQSGVAPAPITSPKPPPSADEPAVRSTEKREPEPARRTAPAAAESPVLVLDPSDSELLEDEPQEELAPDSADASSEIRPTLFPEKHGFHCPDPRTADVRQVRDALVDVVRDFGPMPCHYAYSIYARSAGIGRLSKPMRQILNKAVYMAVRSGTLTQANEYETRDQMNQIVRVSGTPAVRVRPRGDRSLADIPPSEIVAVMTEITAASNVIGRLSQEALFRQVLEHYGLTRLTENARTILALAWNMYKDNHQCIAPKAT